MSKEIIRKEEEELEVYDATNMSADDVLAQIEASMAGMNAVNQKRVVFTNEGKTFEDVLDEKN